MHQPTVKTRVTMKVVERREKKTLGVEKGFEWVVGRGPVCERDRGGTTMKD